jgi:hypothetical protein
MSPTAPNGAPTAAQMVAAANEFASVYSGVVNPNDCTFIAMAVAASIGAVVPYDCESFNPAQNASGGFWRVVYRGSDPNPVADWQTLVQPGDIVRMQWQGETTGHATTILAVNANGSIKVFDNGGGTIGIHNANYDTQTIASSVTIYRLTTDGLFLIAAPDDLGDTLVGNVYNDQIIGGGGNDTLICGTHRDILVGGPGSDTFVLNQLALSFVQTSPSTDEKIVDYDQGNGGTYNAVEGDLIDLSSILSAAYNQGNGVPAASLLRAVEDASGTFADLEVDPNGTPGNWITIAELDGLAAGNTVSAILDGVHFLTISVGVPAPLVVSSGQTVSVTSGQTLSGATVLSGGTVDVFDGGTLTGAIANGGTVYYDIAVSATFADTFSGAGTLVVSGGGALTVTSAYAGAAQVDDNSKLEFAGSYIGALTFSGASVGSGGTVKFDGASTGPITVVKSNDTVIAQPSANNWINAAVSYTLPANIDSLFLYAGSQGAGNGDASGDALWALNAGSAQTLTGNTANDAFVVFNAADVVVPKVGSHDVVYAAASYTLPTGVDTLLLEGTAAQGTGNSDAAGDALYAANPGQVATLTGNSANDVFVVYNSSDVVVPKVGSNDSVYSAVNYTLPTGVDVLFLEAGTQGVGNSDASGDALYAADAGIAQTLTGNSANDAFVVYNSADVVAPKVGSHDTVYSAVNYTLPTGVDVLFLEASTQGGGNSDAAGDVLYAANAGIAQTLTGHSHNDSFVVYNASDVVAGQASSTDTVYAAANFTLPTNVDTLLLEGNASHGTGNGDAVDALFGNGGVASTLVAGSGADTLYVTGTAGTIMTGGAGHDTFAFPNVMGHDEVTNFGIAKDTLQFNMTLFSNFTAAMNAASQVGANTVFTIDANDTVTLDNVTKTSLTASNFHFT